MGRQGDEGADEDESEEGDEEEEADRVSPLTPHQAAAAASAAAQFSAAGGGGGGGGGAELEAYGAGGRAGPSRSAGGPPREGASGPAGGGGPTAVPIPAGPAGGMSRRAESAPAPDVLLSGGPSAARSPPQPRPPSPLGAPAAAPVAIPGAAPADDRAAGAPALCPAESAPATQFPARERAAAAAAAADSGGGGRRGASRWRSGSFRAKLSALMQARPPGRPPAHARLACRHEVVHGSCPWRALSEDAHACAICSHLAASVRTAKPRAVLAGRGSSCASTRSPNLT